MSGTRTRARAPFRQFDGSGAKGALRVPVHGRPSHMETPEHWKTSACNLSAEFADQRRAGMFGLRRASVRAPSPRDGVGRASERFRRADIAGLESAWVGKRRHGERAGARLALPPPRIFPERARLYCE